MGDARVSLEELGRRSAMAAPSGWRERSQALYKEWNAYIEKRSARPCRAPDICACRGRRESPRRRARLGADGGGRHAGELEMNWRAKGSAPSTANSAIPAWATRSPAAGGRRWPIRARRLRHGGRRQLSFDELGHLFLGPHRPQADRRSSATMAGSSSSTACNAPRAFPPSTFARHLPDRERRFRVYFAKHAEAMGAIGIRVASIGDLEMRSVRRKPPTGRRHPHRRPSTDWTGNDNSWWECGTPEVSERDAVSGQGRHVAGKKKQRVGSEPWRSGSASPPSAGPMTTAGARRRHPLEQCLKEARAAPMPGSRRAASSRWTRSS